MINEQKASAYCFEDISKIENYNDAINDHSSMWHCHHRKEIHTPKQKLLEQNEYWSVPAKDLIFLPPSEHLKIHFNSCVDSHNRCKKISTKLKGNKNHINSSRFKNHHHTEQAKKRIGQASALRCGANSSRIRKDVWKHKDKILKLLDSGLSDRKIAKLYHCSRTVISNIKLTAS